jgi:bifunctional non-homologous end joining protein LigD
MLNGRDMRQLPLVERKARLKTIMPRVQSRIRYVDHIAGSGSAFYRAVCDHDLEGIAAKWRNGTYQAAGRTSWLKIKNPDYSQAEGRHELFEKRRKAEGRKRWQRPELLLA